MLRIYVNRAALRSGEPAVTVIGPGRRDVHYGVEIDGPSRLVCEDRKLWIETDSEVREIPVTDAVESVVSVTVGDACTHEHIDFNQSVQRKGEAYLLRIGPIVCRDCRQVMRIIAGKNVYRSTANIVFGTFDNPVQTEPPRSSGPGTEMIALTEELGIESKPGCTCKSTAMTMDRLGVEGCRNRINELTLTVEANWESWGWKDKLRAVTKAAWKAAGLGVKPTDPVRSLLELAIERADKADDS